MDTRNSNNGELLTRQRLHAPEIPASHPAEPEVPAPEEKQELSGRFRELNRLLERERSAAESSISSKEYFLEQLRSNLRELESISDELEELSAPGLRSEKERNALLEKLFLRYYRAGGTIAGLSERERSIASVAETAAPPKTFGTLFFENLPRLIGTLLGAAIIAIAIAAVFS